MSDAEVRALERSVLDEPAGRDAWEALIAAAARSGATVSSAVVLARVTSLVSRVGAPVEETLQGIRTLVLRSYTDHGARFGVVLARRDGSRRVDGRPTAEDVLAGLGPAHVRAAQAILPMADDAEIPDWLTHELHEATCRRLVAAGMGIPQDSSPGFAFGVPYAQPISGTVPQGTRMRAVQARTLAANLACPPGSPRFFQGSGRATGPVLLCGPDHHVDLNGADAAFTVVYSLRAVEVRLLDACAVEFSRFGSRAPVGWVVAASATLASDTVVLPVAEAAAFAGGR